MKKIFFYHARLGIWVTAFSSVLCAGGFEFPGVGARALGMGGAYTALANDWTATYWNPAGLAELDHSGLGFELSLLQSKTLDGNSIANPGIPYTASNRDQGDIFINLGGEPARFNATTSRMRIPLPSLGSYIRVGRWTLAGSVHTPLGFSNDVTDDSVASLHMNYKSRGVIAMSGFSAGTSVNEYVSLGVGFHALSGFLEREATKVSPTYTSHAEAEGKDLFSPQGVLGIIVKANSKWRMGVSYRTPSKLKISGDASATDSRFPLTVPGATLRNETSSFENELAIPATYGIGTAYTPHASWTVSADWQGTDWRTYRSKITYATPGLIFQNRDVDADWTFTHRARVGSEYRFSKAWAWRAGYTYDPKALPDRAESMTHIIDTTRNFLSTGLGWANERWRLDMAYLYGWGYGEISGVRYGRQSHLLVTGISFRV